MQRNFGPVMQIAWVVRDLHAAIDHWTGVMHVGPFFLFEHVQFAELLFRGKPSPVDMTAALAYSGETQIELICQHNDAPSIYTEFLGAGRTGVQHLGVMTASVDRDLERLGAHGITAAQSGRTAWGARFAYLATDHDPGGMIELIEHGPVIDHAFRQIRDAARSWDGRTRIAKLG
jgi:hypothetical protein